jgi:hypothetical protein
MAPKLTHHSTPRGVPSPGRRDRRELMVSSAVPADTGCKRTFTTASERQQVGQDGHRVVLPVHQPAASAVVQSGRRGGPPPQRRQVRSGKSMSRQNLAVDMPGSTRITLEVAEGPTGPPRTSSTPAARLRPRPGPGSGRRSRRPAAAPGSRDRTSRPPARSYQPRGSRPFTGRSTAR